MEVTLPAIPTVDGGLLEQSDAEHRGVAERLQAMDDGERRTLQVMAWGRIIEAIAGAGAIEYDHVAPAILFPPRRRHLPPELVARSTGVESALVYLDERLRLVELGVIDHVVAAETPMVLNAFAAGRDASGAVPMAGMVRVTATSYRDAGAEFVPPSPRLCRDLLEQTVEVVRAGPPVHRLELAAWTSLMLFAIHPFADGNGRTARLLFQGIHSSAGVGGFDLGTIEAWTLHRRRYIEAIQRSLPAGPPDSLLQVEPNAFASFAAQASVDGARRWRHRIEKFETFLATWRPKLGDAALTLAFVSFERNVSPDELGVLTSRPEQVGIAEELVRRDLLRRDRLGRYDPV